MQTLVCLSDFVSFCMHSFLLCNCAAARVQSVSLRNSWFVTDLRACSQLVAIEVLGDAHSAEVRWSDAKHYVVPRCMEDGYDDEVGDSDGHEVDADAGG